MWFHISFEKPSFCSLRYFGIPGLALPGVEILFRICDVGSKVLEILYMFQRCTMNRGDARVHVVNIDEHKLSLGGIDMQPDCCRLKIVKESIICALSMLISVLYQWNMITVTDHQRKIETK